jgi:hypothetical protein
MGSNNLDQWKEKRSAFVHERSSELADNDAARILHLGLPEERPTTVRDGVTIQYQQAELEISARPVPPFPFPMSQLLDTPEKQARLDAVWMQTEVIRTRVANASDPNGSLKCEICDELFEPADSSTLVEHCCAVDCSSHARAHMRCIRENDEDIVHGSWYCDGCTNVQDD